MAEMWACSICGLHPNSRADWCDAGCGSDYNEMFLVKHLDRHDEQRFRRIAELEHGLKEIMQHAQEAGGHAGEIQELVPADIKNRTDNPIWVAAHTIGARTFCIIHRCRRLLTKGAE